MQEIKDFKDGYAGYKIRSTDTLPDEFFDIRQWQNGYYEFSSREIKLEKWNTLNLTSDFNFHKDRISPELGYLTGLDIWCSNPDNTRFKEICVERNDHGEFIIQEWYLALRQPKDKKEFFDCFYRPVSTRPAKGFLEKDPAGINFKKEELTSFEVIVPEYRYHFYIIRGETHAAVC